jgi:hypothetical protein
MWGTGEWGALVWGAPAVPGLSLGTLLLLMLGCFLAGGWLSRPGRRGPRGTAVAALLILLPISVGALTLPHLFENGTIADATQVNANFEAISSALDAATCPSGMTAIAMPHGTLCYADGPLGTWDQASAHCSDVYRARVCSLQQWRDAVCVSGVPNPGASWTDSVTGTASLGVISGCSGDSLSSSVYTTQRNTTCCVEWPRY